MKTNLKNIVKTSYVTLTTFVILCTFLSSGVSDVSRCEEKDPACDMALTSDPWRELKGAQALKDRPLPSHYMLLPTACVLPRHTYPTNCITRANGKPFNLCVEATSQLSARRCGAVEVILLFKSRASMWLPTTSSGLTIGNQQLLQSPRRSSTGQNNNTPVF